jgi:pimeloyl-[acyl-carrier protein] methyl ester esterase
MDKLKLVLLPGMDGTGILFRPLIEALPPGIEAWVVRYPGDRPQSYEELLPLVLSSLPESGDYILLGESFSGPLALRAACVRPKGLRGVVLSASFIRNPMRYVPSWLRFLARGFLFSVWPVSVRVRGLTGKGGGNGIRKLCFEAAGEVTDSVLAFRAREILKVNSEKELRACPVPILYLKGEYDIVVREHNCDAIASIRPDMRIATFKTSHLLLQEAPSEAAGEIEMFADSITSR